MPKKIDYAALYSKRKDGRYRASYTDAAGRRHYVYDRDPKELYLKMLAIESGPAPISFSDAVDAWERVHLEEVAYKTRESYTGPVKRLREQFGAQALDDITPAQISAFLQSLAAKGYARRTVRQHRDIMSMIFSRAIVDGHIKHNPVSAASVPKNLPSTQRELPDDEIIERIKAHPEYNFALFAFFGLYAGLRRGEILALTYEDIDRSAGLIHVRRAVEFVSNGPHLKEPKTAAGARAVPLLTPLADQVPKNGHGLIFCDKKGQLLTKTMFRRRWDAYCAQIGHHIGTHQLRHAYATILYDAGVADRDAMELLGHSSITVTRDIYTHIRQARRTAVAAQIESFVTGSESKKSP